MKMEIKNPRDKWFLENEDLEASAFVTMHISNGNYALSDMDGNQLMPLFLFGGAEEYWQKEFKHTITEFLESDGIHKRLADACESFSYEKERSSLNDIGEAYKNFGKRLRDKSEEESA